METPAILISQYLASLEMLKQTITQCPESIWNAQADRNKFWHTAYHALFFTHLYVSDSEETFSPWIKHRAGYEDFEGLKDFVPYEKETILEYLSFCQHEVAGRLPRMHLDEQEGFGDRTMSKFELQIYSIRHIMQHAGELMERLGSRTGAEIDWVGWKHD